MTSKGNATLTFKKTVKEFNSKRLKEGKEEVVVVMKRSADRLEEDIDELEKTNRDLNTYWFLSKCAITVYGIHRFVEFVWR